MNRLKRASTWALPILLTVIAVVWAVVAIGGILTATAHPVLAYGTAVLYDAVWLYALAQETAHRRQGTSARLPKVLGWIFLPLTVAVLAVHGLLAADVLAAIVGALVPVLAKTTLVMAIDRDTTRISPRAQSAIDRTRATTRDKIAVSRAIATARADETKAAADIVKHTRRAEAEATTTVHQALEAHAEIIDRHGVPDWHTTLPALVSDHELDALLAGDQARRPGTTPQREPLPDAAQEDTPTPVVEVEVDRPEVPPITPVEVTAAEPVAIEPPEPAPAVQPLVICGDRRVWHPEFPSRDEDDEVSGATGDRLPTEAAANVIRAAWVLGTSVTETARQATRSTSYVKKVFARLEEERTKEWPPLKRGEAS